MEAAEHELIVKVSADNRRIKKLYSEHQELEEHIGILERKSFLTATEEQMLKEMKKRKLLGVDEMLSFIRER